MDGRWIAFARLAARDLLGRRQPIAPLRRHLEAAAAWLERAHEQSPDGGVSYGYSIRTGWRPAYRETSGYIAETYFDLAVALRQPRLRDRAIAVAHWLCTVQNPDGSISNPSWKPEQGIVFDTGQVLHGWVRAFEETGDHAFLEAGRRAGDWLVTVADAEGRWTRSTFRGIPHVYNTRVAWALLRLQALEGDERYERVARANLDWALSQQRQGWFDQCAFEAGVPPFTHTIAYALRGLLESGRLLGDSKYGDSALRGAEAVLGHVRADGFVPGRIDVDGRAHASYCCVTGNAQLAIVWAKLYEDRGDGRFRDAAVKALRYAMSVQDIDTADPNVRGAIPGSKPVWGAYSPFTFPNWATKFFIDALLLCERWMS